ncbi:hypothetical protein [Mesorhizobium sp. B2-3-5]|uniref:hypothetical protein n=1 Tax=Mesorhizobium sp. B2-3-5 TaxID=2589958 RepID=UPI001FEFE405|nr:hypothetical protein [Mesorhizobium sp. B2-3-5]
MWKSCDPFLKVCDNLGERLMGNPIFKSCNVNIGTIDLHDAWASTISSSTEGVRVPIGEVYVAATHQRASSASSSSDGSYIPYPYKIRAQPLLTCRRSVSCPKGQRSPMCRQSSARSLVFEEIDRYPRISCTGMGSVATRTGVTTGALYARLTRRGCSNCSVIDALWLEGKLAWEPSRCGRMALALASQISRTSESPACFPVTQDRRPDHTLFEGPVQSG